MRMASISETKNNLSSYIDMVRKGETVVITDRNRPVARLEPIRCDDSWQIEERLLHLERAGLIKLSAKKPSAKAILDLPGLDQSGLLAALLANREEER